MSRGGPHHANSVRTEAPPILVALGLSHMSTYRLIVIAVSAAAAQPTPISPTATAGKAYIGVF